MSKSNTTNRPTMYALVLSQADIQRLRALLSYEITHL